MRDRCDRVNIAGKTQDHVLVTVLGTNPRTACYELGSRRCETSLAPVALFQLLSEDERPDRVLALCTEEAARDSWPVLESRLSAMAPVKCLIVPSGHAPEDADSFLDAVCKELKGKERKDLTLDVTHGFRHFSFLTYTAVLYLEALGIVHVRGAYYGLLATGEPSPFFDLRPLLALPKWVYILRVLRETGSAMPMASALETDRPQQSAKQIAERLRNLSEAYLSGLPIEFGRCAHDTLNDLRPLAKVLRREHNLPLASDLTRQVSDPLKTFAMADPVHGDGWKGKVGLTGEELVRQARIIENLLERGSVPTALGLMHEWTVSWVLWRLNEQSEWLNYHGARRGAAKLLQALRELRADPELSSILSENQYRLGTYWDDLSNLRNAYAHHGMRRANLLGHNSAAQRDRVVEMWKGLCRCPDWCLTLEGVGGRLLVSPIGMRPGVLFSALRTFRSVDDCSATATCVAICSPKTEPLIAEATIAARYSGRVVRLCVDPYGGRREIEKARKLGRRHLVGAEEVLVNVTGGTTVMGLVAEALATEARRFASQVQRFGLIDRRSPAQQDANPFQVGEPFWLDGKEAGHVGAD